MDKKQPPLWRVVVPILPWLLVAGITSAICWRTVYASLPWLALAIITLGVLLAEAARGFGSR
jgi:hypothetical protein